MTTGYTSPVENAEITSFRKFALLCTEAFGVQVSEKTLEPKPFSSDIGYHQKSLNAARRKLALAEKMTMKQWAAKAEKNYVAVLKAWGHDTNQGQLATSRLQSMLDQVQSWTPPTSEHEGLKKFMMEQLQGSLERVWLPKRPQKLTAAETKTHSLKSLYSDLDYHSSKIEAETERTAKSNQWVNDLLGSL